MGYQETVSFRSDDYTLQGVLHLPNTEQPPVVIGSHGLFSDKNSPKQIELARTLNQLGVAFLRLDHRGCGESDGRFGEVTSLEGRTKDLETALQFISQHPSLGNRYGLFGSSMGGATVLNLSSRKSADCIVTLAAPIRSRPILEAAISTGDLRGLPLSFYETNLSFDIAAKTKSISHILIFHGDADVVVPVDNAHELYANARMPKDLIIQINGDHPVTDLNHQQEFIQKTTAWFHRWLVDSPPK